jgi:hypothetical protein
MYFNVTLTWKDKFDYVKPLTPNDLYRRRAVSPLKITRAAVNLRLRPRGHWDWRIYWLLKQNILTVE